MQHRTSNRGVVVQEGADALRQGEHPLGHGKPQLDVIDEMGGSLDHAASIAGGTHAAALARTLRCQRLSRLATRPCERNTERVRSVVEPESLLPFRCITNLSEYKTHTSLSKRYCVTLLRRDLIPKGSSSTYESVWK